MTVLLASPLRRLTRALGRAHRLMNPFTLLAMLLACGKTTEPQSFDVEIVISEEIPTVATISWSTNISEPIAARVLFGEKDGRRHVVEVDTSPDFPWSNVLIGMKPATAQSLVLEVDTANETVSSDEIAFSTGPQPTSLSQLTLTGSGDSEIADGLLVLPLVNQNMATIVDGDGDYVWWREVETLDSLGSLELSVDRASMLAVPVNPTGELTDSALFRIPLDGSELERIPLQDLHHDVAELPDGTIGYLVHDSRIHDGETIRGDAIWELSPDGSTREIWSGWDDFDPSTMDESVGSLGWTHANSLQYDPESDAYHIGFMSLGAIAKIDRSSGLLWTLGGTVSDFATASGETVLFDRNHQFEFLDDTVLVFANGEPDVGNSMAIELRFSETDPVVEQIWSYQADPSLYCFSLGNANRLPEGNTLVNFSVNGRIDEVDVSGEIVWQLSSELGGAFGYSQWVSALDATPAR